MISRDSATAHGLTEREKVLRRKIRIREKQTRRLYMLAQILAKTFLGRVFRAAHDFHLAHVLKTHGMPVAVIDYVAVHGFCMTESMRHEREQYFVKSRAATIPWYSAIFGPRRLLLEPPYM